MCEKGLVSGRLAVTDSTHIKANASRNSEYLVEMQEDAGNYWERLDVYEEEGLEELARRTGKRRAKRTKQVKKDKQRSHKRVSHTDTESGYMTRLDRQDRKSCVKGEIPQSRKMDINNARDA